MWELMSEILLQQILSELKSVKTDVESMKADFQGMKADFQGMKTDIEGMKTDIEGMKTDIKGIKQEQQLMKIQLDENTQMIRAIYDRQEETDARQEALTMDVHKLHGEVTAIKEEQALYSDILQKLAEGQARQEKILERLSVRSIEQEADILAVRRAI